MSPLAAVLIFVGIPVALAVVVFALVSASSWTRSGRSSDDYEGSPFLIASGPALPDPGRLPSDLGVSTTAAGGGVSARW